MNAWQDFPTAPTSILYTFCDKAQFIVPEQAQDSLHVNDIYRSVCFKILDTLVRVSFLMILSTIGTLRKNNFESLRNSANVSVWHPALETRPLSIQSYTAVTQLAAI